MKLNDTETNNLTTINEVETSTKIEMLFNDYLLTDGGI